MKKFAISLTLRAIGWLATGAMGLSVIALFVAPFL